MLEYSATRSKKSQPSGEPDEHKLLQVQIEQALKYYKLAYSSLKQTEQHLHAFLTDYYHKVGRQFQQLVALHERVVHASALSFSEDSVPVDDAFYRKHETPWDSHVKSMYRKLIKEYHPDATGSWRRESASTMDEVMMRINSAYASKDMVTLLKLDLEKSTEKLTALQRDSYLREQVLKLQESVKLLVERKHRIKKSPAYLLMKKVQDAREQGVDLVATIKEEVQEQIDRQMAFIWHNPHELLLEDEQLALLAGHA